MIVLIGCVSVTRGAKIPKISLSSYVIGPLDDMFLCSSRSFLSWMTMASRPSAVRSKDLDFSLELPASDSASLQDATGNCNSL